MHHGKGTGTTTLSWYGCDNSLLLRVRQFPARTSTPAIESSDINSLIGAVDKLESWKSSLVMEASYGESLPSGTLLMVGTVFAPNTEKADVVLLLKRCARAAGLR